MGFGKLIDPLAALFIRLHVRPNLITTVGTLVIIGSATAFGLGWVRSGGFLLLVSGIFDMVDAASRGGGYVHDLRRVLRPTLDGWANRSCSAGSPCISARRCAPRAPGARGGGVPHRPGGVLDRVLHAGPRRRIGPHRQGGHSAAGRARAAAGRSDAVFRARNHGSLLF